MKTNLRSGPVTPGTDDTLSIKTDSSLDETDYDVLPDADLDKNIFRTKSWLYVCHLAKKNPSVLKKKSQLYLWNLLTVAVFYFLPVVQLVIIQQVRLFSFYLFSVILFYIVIKIISLSGHEQLRQP